MHSDANRLWTAGPVRIGAHSDARRACNSDATQAHSHLEVRRTWACAYGELDERLAAYERAGANTLLALPFGDRPRIVEGLGAAVVA